jgi:lysophospholipase L1-like esterase
MDPIILSLGDSYTIGEGVPAGERWPVHLVALLREGWQEEWGAGGRGEGPEGRPGGRAQDRPGGGQGGGQGRPGGQPEVRVVADPVVVARTGWTAEELQAAVDGLGRELTLHAPYRLVTLLVGVNDQYRGRSPGEFRPSYRRILDTAVRFAGGDPRRVLVPSIPDWGATPFAAGRDREAIAAGIDAFNGVVQEEVQAVGAQFVDLTSLSRQLGADPAFLAEDGLHYSGRMYRLWAERLLPHARRVLVAPPPAGAQFRSP